MGSLPPQLSSISEPRWRFSGPLTVPEANKSPVRRDAPFAVMCASICGALQYIPPNCGREIRCSFSRTSNSMSRPHASAALSSRYGSSAWLRAGGATRAASSASSGTIHGAMLVANDFPKNGPSGTYSQAWMSRADQSFTRHTPKT